MRDHNACEDSINAALAKGNSGQAEFLATRCDIEHGPQAAARAALATDPSEEMRDE